MPAEARGTAGLVAGAVVLVLLAVLDRRPAPAVLPSLDDQLAAWAAAHGAAVGRLTRLWLTVGYRLAVPLARLGIGPDVVTLSALWWTGLALAVPPLPALVALLLAGLADVVDGALATLTGRGSPVGAVLDALVDRLVDVALLVLLLRLGAPGTACIVAGVLLGLLEYVRSRAQAAGMDGPGAVTVGERPVRVAVVLGVVLTAGLRPSHVAAAAQTGVGLEIGLTGLGLLTLLAAVRAELRSGGTSVRRR